MGRRGIKEYRAAEALTLIAADRDHQPLVCPSCGSDDIDRIPRRDPQAHDQGRITLHCIACGRSAVYTALAGSGFSEQPGSEKPNTAKPVRH